MFCNRVNGKYQVNGEEFNIVQIDSMCEEISIEKVKCDASTYELKMHFCPHRGKKGSGKTAIKVVTDTLGTRTFSCRYFVIP